MKTMLEMMSLPGVDNSRTILEMQKKQKERMNKDLRHMMIASAIMSKGYKRSPKK